MHSSFVRLDVDVTEWALSLSIGQFLDSRHFFHYDIYLVIFPALKQT